MSDEEIVRITKGPDDLRWSPFEAALIRAADELYYTDIISDATWKILSGKYEEKKLIDVVITVGQ